MPDELREALTALARVPVLLVASDFDGVLAPIIDDPSASRPVPGSRDALVALGGLPNTTAALISGRDRAELLRLSGMPAHVQAVGSHGAEFADGFAGGIDDDARARHTRVRHELARLIDGRDGVRLEVKPASVAVHVRLAASEVAAAVLDEVRAGPARWDGVHTTEGKAVIELAVIDTDKGRALDVLRHGAGADAVLYLGDDVTDEKAFARLRGSDVGIKVGEGETAARYRVEDPAGVAVALALLLTARRR